MCYNIADEAYTIAHKRTMEIFLIFLVFLWYDTSIAQVYFYVNRKLQIFLCLAQVYAFNKYFYIDSTICIFVAICIISGKNKS